MGPVWLLLGVALGALAAWALLRARIDAERRGAEERLDAERAAAAERVDHERALAAERVESITQARDELANQFTALS
ncbi:MAG: DNA recombination protein RmuC, partial [Solirubrobacterales bacterium]|nr:DNA recombination protein RmuC [Solirubrobacterales bacterium]